MAKILVVEDDKFLANAYRVKLTKSGFEVIIASDGEEALAVLQQQLPDLILLDLVMPKKDGFVTLAEIKADPKLSSIPVMVASNLGQKEDLDKATSLGAIDYVIKSDLSMEHLVNKVNAILHPQGIPAPEVATQEVPAQVPPPSESPAPVPTTPEAPSSATLAPETPAQPPTPEPLVPESPTTT